MKKIADIFSHKSLHITLIKYNKCECNADPFSLDCIGDVFSLFCLLRNVWVVNYINVFIKIGQDKTEKLFNKKSWTFHLKNFTRILLQNMNAHYNGNVMTLCSPWFL